METMNTIPQVMNAIESGKRKGTTLFIRYSDGSHYVRTYKRKEAAQFRDDTSICGACFLSAVVL